MLALDLSYIISIRSKLSIGIFGKKIAVPMQFLLKFSFVPLRPTTTDEVGHTLFIAEIQSGVDVG